MDMDSYTFLIVIGHDLPRTPKCQAPMIHAATRETAPSIPVTPGETVKEAAARAAFYPGSGRLWLA